MNSVSIDKAVIEQAEQEPECKCENPFNECRLNESCRVFRAIDVAPPKAEQEPVVKIHKYNEFQTLGSLNLPIGTKLYAAPVRTKDLTDDEIAAVYEQDEHHHGEFNYRFDPVSFARAIIAAYKAKQNQ